MPGVPPEEKAPNPRAAERQKHVLRENQMVEFE